MGFEPVEAKVDLPAMERRILEVWRERRVFERSVEARRGSPEWVFYDGPPTANGRPHIGHVEARTFKDLYPRYKTMTSHLVLRKAGWDCHGLPVELEVEKEIGTKTKRDIEAFGIAEFNRRCRESVVRYVDDWRAMSERIGFWIDMDHPYWTMDARYIESEWWALKRLFEEGLLFEADKVTAYCPRCGTALSDAEVAMGYAQALDPSIYVRFPILTGPLAAEGADLLIWTTMPWTLVPATLAVVGDGIRYVLARGGRAGNRPVVVSAELLQEALGEGAEVMSDVSLDELAGARYRGPFNFVGPGSDEDPKGDPSSWRFVVVGDFVKTDEGTGVVHTGAAYGEDDLRVAREHGAPVVKPVDADGRFDERVGPYAGMHIREADALIIEDLREAGLLVSAETYTHSYPFCWRCGTPLIYMALTSWYVRTTARKERLLEVNERVNWYPAHIKRGRYGDWLSNNVDWALSRSRYWGTPLPLWRCAAGHVTPVGSLTELSTLAGRDLSTLDPHRPAVDEVEIPCRECGRTATRVPEVIDTWFDSGAMPYAQWHYHPDLGRGLEEFAGRYPADFIAEGLDQTRGWFYTLMAEGVLLFDDTAYRNVVCHGLVVDAEGRKMSKSIGNVLDPYELLDAHGADAVRWYMVVAGSPWVDKRISHEAVEEVVRQFLLTLWNVYAFFVTYANVDGWEPGREAPPLADRAPLDRWILSRLAGTVEESRRSLEDFDATAAGRAAARFLDELSNWYVRRARRRFWDPTRGAAEADKRSAYATLHECLTTLARLLAPFTPFVTEELWANLAAGREGQPDSVHLADYPEPDASARDPELEAAMDAVRTIVSLGRTVRTDAKVRVRQPLRRAFVHLAGDPSRLRPVLPLAAEELNVKDVQFAGTAEELATWRARPNFRLLGPRLGARVKSVAAALDADDGSLAARLASGESVELVVDGEAVTLGTDDVELRQEVHEGWGVAADGGVTVALDLEVDDALRREGLAREVVRIVQDARKAAGLDVTDRIRLDVTATDEVREALEQHRDHVAGETLATSFIIATLADEDRGDALSIDGGAVRVRVSLMG